MKAIILDTETTGLTRLSFANQFNYRQWPRLVQLAWAIIEDGAIVSKYSTLVRPVGFAIPLTSFRLHGITREKAEAAGIPIADALDELTSACRGTECIIAHNLNFDLGVLQSEAIRLGKRFDPPPRRCCTMHLGRSFLVKEYGIKRGGFPSLGRLYEALHGFDYSVKHEAEVDVTACFHVYKKLSQLGYR